MSEEFECSWFSAMGGFFPPLSLNSLIYFSSSVIGRSSKEASSVSVSFRKESLSHSFAIRPPSI